MGHLESFLAVMRADGAVIHRPENMRWLTGYTGEGCLFMAGEKRLLFTDSRYIEQAHRQAGEWDVVQITVQASYPARLAEAAAGQGVRSLLLETDYLTFDDYQAYAAALEGVELLPMGDLLRRLRRVKDARELSAIRRAADIASRAFMNILPRIHEGMTERQVQRILEFEMLECGSEGTAFETIAAAGPNGALPHARPSVRPIQRGELLTLDFGATCEGYRSDMTRTVGIGKVPQALRDVYETVRTAQQMGLEALAPGRACREVDLTVRAYVDERYPGAFGHGLGHGVGLYIHEEPRLSTTSEDVLEPGHVVTVEPGVYIPGLGGCRIEDTVIITGAGTENTISAPRELIEL